MIPLLVGVAAATVATAVIGLLVVLVLRCLGRRPRWRTFGFVVLGSVLFHALVTVPAAFGVLAAHGMVHTRGDERDYAGPQLDAEGHVRPQARRDFLAGPSPFEIELTAADGIRLRAFSIPTRAGIAPRAVAVLAHGLFRGGLELEPIAADFHELGLHVVMIELRNHGGSGRAAATFGQSERQDVLAAATWVRSQDELRELPLVFFGVSLGTAAVVFAAAELDPPPAALVLDSPIDDVLATAHRMLAEGPRRRSGFAFPQPFRSLVLTWLGIASGVDLGDERPIDVLRNLAPLQAGLVIAGGEDHRTPPDVARAMFEAMPVIDGQKELWILPGAGHGDVRESDPEGYRERLAWLCGRLPGR